MPVAHFAKTESKKPSAEENNPLRAGVVIDGELAQLFKAL